MPCRPFAPWEGCCICWEDEDRKHILLCDKCDAEYHTYCLHPPLEDVPEGAVLRKVFAVLCHCVTDIASIAANAAAVCQEIRHGTGFTLRHQVPWSCVKRECNEWSHARVYPGALCASCLCILGECCSCNALHIKTMSTQKEVTCSFWVLLRSLLKAFCHSCFSFRQLSGTWPIAVHAAMVTMSRLPPHVMLHTSKAGGLWPDVGNNMSINTLM